MIPYHVYILRVLSEIKHKNSVFNIDRIPYYALTSCYQSNYGIEYAAEYLIQKYTK